MDLHRKVPTCRCTESDDHTCTHTVCRPLTGSPIKTLSWYYNIYRAQNPSEPILENNTQSIQDTHLQIEQADLSHLFEGRDDPLLIGPAHPHNAEATSTSETHVPGNVHARVHIHVQ